MSPKAEHLCGEMTMALVRNGREKKHRLVRVERDDEGHNVSTQRRNQKTTATTTTTITITTTTITPGEKKLHLFQN